MSMHALVFHRVKTFNVKNVSVEEINKIFSKYGDVVDVYKPKSLLTNDFHDHAFITYASTWEAMVAVTHPNTMLSSQ